MAPVSAAIAHWGIEVLTELRGLRISRRPPSVASASRAAAVEGVPCSATVCEAQDTAGMAITCNGVCQTSAC